jgi:hypothetical protein
MAKTKHHPFFLDDPDGAVDMSDCSMVRRTKGGSLRCACGLCGVCGHPKHSAMHGPLYGGRPGSKPYGHRFAAMREEN